MTVMEQKSLLRMLITLLLSLSLLTVPFPSRTSAAETFTMAFMQEPSEDMMWRWAELIYTEAFQRNGLKFHYKVYPPARAGVTADSGQVDGEAARIKTYGETYKNLIRIEEAILVDKIVACAAKSDMAIENWDSFKQTGYRVDYYRGIAIVEQRLSKVVPSENLSPVSEPIHALKKLKAGRTEVYVDSEARIMPFLNEPEFKNSELHVITALEEIPSFPYVHKRHSGLVPRLAETLKQMKTEGLFEQYMEQARQEFTQE